MSNISNSNTDVLFYGGLTATLIGFIILKLTGLVAWSWCVVFSPVWIPFIVFVVVMAITSLIILSKGD